MNIREAYNRWSDSYDDVENKTRDLEAKALNNTLANRRFESALELGCGTGKNTKHLDGICNRLTAVDFSEGMLQKAKQKILLTNVEFVQADITQPWSFVKRSYDLITCSLILEHIENLDHIFHQAAFALNANGLFYICELHAFKQYQGSKARFDTGDGLFELECFTHHVSDYFNAAIRNGFVCDALQEWFDDDNRANTPRLISFVFRKST